jgi:hypothetical protein
MEIHNAHVIKWYRWKIWCAKQRGSPFALTLLIQWHNEEIVYANSTPAAAHVNNRHGVL